MPLPQTDPLWTSARSMLVQLLCVAGIETLAIVARLSERQLKIVRSWIAPLEIMVRKLLLIEAAALEPVHPRAAKPARNAAANTTGKPTGKPKRRTRAFRLIPPNARPRKALQRIRRLGPPLIARDAWRDAQRSALIARLRTAPRPAPHARIANRIRALAAVLHNPTPHARRLARLLTHSSRAALTMDCIAYAPVHDAPYGFALADLYRANTEACTIDRTLLLQRRR